MTSQSEVAQVIDPVRRASSRGQNYCRSIYGGSALNRRVE